MNCLRSTLMNVAGRACIGGVGIRVIGSQAPGSAAVLGASQLLPNTFNVTCPSTVYVTSVLPYNHLPMMPPSWELDLLLKSSP